MCITPTRKGYCMSTNSNDPDPYKLLTPTDTPLMPGHQVCWGRDGNIVSWGGGISCHGGRGNECNSFIRPDGNVKF